MSEALAKKLDPVEQYALDVGMTADGAWSMLRNTVVSTKDNTPATQDQIVAALIVAQSVGLDPLRREIYFFADPRKGIVPIVGVDGWIKLINKNAQFNGMELTPGLNERGELVSYTCKIYRRDIEHPVIVTEYLSECARDTDPWKKMPHRMLRWKALNQGGRVAFGLSGIYDEDEAQDILGDVKQVESTVTATTYAPPADAPKKKTQPKQAPATQAQAAPDPAPPKQQTRPAQQAPPAEAVYDPAPPPAQTEQDAPPPPPDEQPAKIISQDQFEYLWFEFRGLVKTDRSVKKKSPIPSDQDLVRFVNLKLGCKTRDIPVTEFDSVVAWARQHQLGDKIEL